MPKAGEYLLDTNAAIAATQADPKIEKLIKAATAVYISSTIFGEMFYGAFKSGRVAKNIAQVEALSKKVNHLECNYESARLYGQIRNELRAKGRPIPENDIWIAAIARQHDITLLTRDKHFQEVDNLSV